MKKNLLTQIFLFCVSFVVVSPISALTEKQKIEAEIIGGITLMMGGSMGGIYFNMDQDNVIVPDDPNWSHLSGREHVGRTFFTVERSGSSPWGQMYDGEKSINWQSLCSGASAAGGLLLLLKGLYDLHHLRTQEVAEEEQQQEQEESEDYDK